MPLLKKSFSDQSKHAKRPEWQRAHSHPNPHNTVPKPLVPVSESTKNKLQAFQFAPPKQSDPYDELLGPTTLNKENDATLTLPKASPKAGNAAADAMTPIARPAWQDLLGGAQTDNHGNDASPGEHVMWRPGHKASPDASMSPVHAKKGRKRRARSSSPVSSPATSRTPAPKRKLSGQNQHTTPHADPALSLWDRGTASAMNPLLARMQVTSSPCPKADRTPGSERSLRKSASCGSNWPKRRKIETLDVEQSALSQDNNVQPTSKTSLVSALLQQVDGDIRKSDTHAEEEQLSSPSRRRSPRRSRPQVRRAAVPSPIQEAGETNLLRPSPPSSDTMEEPDNKKLEPAVVPSSSDYGDDDFDEDTLMELEAIVNHPLQAKDTTLIEVNEPSPPVATPCIVKALADDEDEFGDLDDDLFEGTEDMMAQVESKHATQAAYQGGRQTALPQANLGEEEDDSYGMDDDFGEDIDLDAIELAAATQSAARASAVTTSSQKRRIQRYLVTNVLESHYVDDRGRECPEKLLLVQLDRTSEMRTIHLRGDWYDTEAHVKAFVHVIGDFESSGRCIIDNHDNMLILHPDQLISATVLADSFTCMRRAVLQDRVKATGETSKALIFGTVLHEIFQEALMANNWVPKFLYALVDKTLRRHLEDLYVIKMGLDEARTEIYEKMDGLRKWATTFIAAKPNPGALVVGRNGEKVNMCVSKLLDVEEHVWSPMYGLKGNIDATVQVTMQDKTGSKTLTVPFEVKTGRSANSSHHAQTLLYNLLLSDRYDVEMLYGILFYMEAKAPAPQTLRIPTVERELRHMIMQRNRLACYTRERSVQLPSMKRDNFLCGKCYAQTTCFVYHKLADDGTGETSGLKEKFDELVQHLTPAHKEFFLKWEGLLTKEEKESQKHARELWTMLSTERERLGRCIADVVIEKESTFEDKQWTKINRFSYTFVRDTPGPSFLDSQLAVGEPIVISDEQGHFALAIGYVTAVRRNKITVAVDRRLHNARIRQPGFDAVNNQVFASVMDVGGTPKPTPSFNESNPIRYRVDKDEFSNGMATVRNNIVQVMSNEAAGPLIRRLVVDLAPPKFKFSPTQYTIADREELNSDQEAAIQKVMCAEDYALVLGMPGTGKTTTIAHIIRALISQGKTVLLASYTHSAVDNILLKLKHDKTPVLRIGAEAKIHPEVRDFAILANHPKSTYDEIREAWLDTPIVATTCLGINHKLFTQRTFDYCIVDEASQITLPVCVGPIRLARTFVLVGDHNQLPPLVQNEAARLGGLDISLFKLLSDTHPSSVVNLTHQYRMSEDIMSLSNKLIYHGRLKCGTASLRDAVLDIPHLESGLRQRHFDASTFALSQHYGGGAYHTSPAKQFLSAPSPASLCRGPKKSQCWLRDILDPNARVRFINTDALGPSARETAKGARIVNPTEARIVAQLVDALLACGVPAHEVGVMTHYRSQLALLRHLLKGGGTGGGDVEMHTADRFQGRDKEVVVLSLVRSNDQGSIGELLKDWRRINVAFTRAKRKLVVVGSLGTLVGRAKGEGKGGNEKGEGEEMISRFVGLMQEKDWVYEMKSGSLEGHWFPGGGAAGESSVKGSPMNGVGRSPMKAIGGGMGAKSPFKRKGGKRGDEENGAKEEDEEKPLGTSPKKRKATKGGGLLIAKEPKRRQGISQEVMMKGKTVLKDIVNDLMY